MPDVLSAVGRITVPDTAIAVYATNKQVERQARKGGLVDPTALAAAAASLLATYMGRVGGRLVNQVGADVDKAIMARVDTVYKQIKAKLSGDHFAKGALQRLEEQPDNERRKASVEDILLDLIRTDTLIATTLSTLVDDARRANNLALTQIADSGVTVIHGDANLKGRNVAGRDLTVGENRPSEENGVNE